MKSEDLSCQYLKKRGELPALTQRLIGSRLAFSQNGTYFGCFRRRKRA